jgi:hypothetical protein
MAAALHWDHSYLASEERLDGYHWSPAANSWAPAGSVDPCFICIAACHYMCSEQSAAKQRRLCIPPALAGPCLPVADGRCPAAVCKRSHVADVPRKVSAQHPGKGSHLILQVWGFWVQPTLYLILQPSSLLTVVHHPLHRTMAQLLQKIFGGGPSATGDSLPTSFYELSAKYVHLAEPLLCNG